MPRIGSLVTVLVALAACPGSPPPPPGPPAPPALTPPPGSTVAGGPGTMEAPMDAARSQPATDGRLEVQLEIAPGAVMDRVPTRRAILHFHDVGAEPIRIYLPNGEAFRTNISSLVFSAEGAPPLFVPTPRGHGYVVTEADFHLLAPGERRSFPQTFTIDPMFPGGGTQSRRLAGFEPGRAVRVQWTYENQIRRWEGGRPTFDGPTRELFGGQDIPHIWTGRLAVGLEWIAPP